MRTHRPWQPYMSNTPLFNPYTPVTGRATILDHFDLIEEEDESEIPPGEESEQLSDPRPLMKRD